MQTRCSAGHRQSLVLYSTCNAKESAGQVGVTSTKHHLASKFSRGGVFLDLYSPTKIIQPLTSRSGLYRVRLCCFHLVWWGPGDALFCTQFASIITSPEDCPGSQAMKTLVLPQKQPPVRDLFALSSLSLILSPVTAASHQASESEVLVPYEKGCPCQVNECYKWAALYGSPQSDICLC